MDHELEGTAIKKSYEVSFLVEREEGVEEVKRLLGQHGNEAFYEFPYKKVNLAYPIEKKEQAIFGSIKVLSEPQNIKLLEKDLKTNKNILRCLIVALPVEKKTEGEEMKKPSIPMRRPSSIQREASPKPLSNEAIEKKIEEILQ